MTDRETSGEVSAQINNRTINNAAGKRKEIHFHFGSFIKAKYVV